MSLRRIEVADATGSLADCAREVGTGQSPVVIMAEGRPIAAVIPVESEDDLEGIALATNPKFMEMIERSRARQAAEGGISHEELFRELGL